MASHQLPSARRPLRLLLALTVAATLHTVTIAQDDDQPGQPNVIVILADDLGYADVGFHGCRDIRTPNLDRLADQGIVCTAGYVSHPFCSPTRAGLLTGRYQQRFGHENNPTFNPQDEQTGLPSGEITIADVLRKAGYVTGAVGKWHLGAAAPFHPRVRGFDEFIGFLGGGHSYFFKTEARRSPEYLVDVERNGQPLQWKGRYLTDVLSDEALAFVDRHKAAPFLLYLAYNAPHTPLEAPPEYIEKYASIADEKRRVYAAMVTAVDDGVGRLLDRLEDLGLDEQTVLFFLSDNGGPVGINGSSNQPLRAGKGSVYEGGIRVPYVVRWKGHLQPARYGEAVSSLDIFPTAAAVAGGQLPTDRHIDGVNLLPYLRGRQSGAPHETLFWRTGGGAAFAVRTYGDKLVRHSDRNDELYDLSSDTPESHDRLAAEARAARQLRGLLEQWNSQLVPPKWEGPRRRQPL